MAENHYIGNHDCTCLSRFRLQPTATHVPRVRDGAPGTDQENRESEVTRGKLKRFRRPSHLALFSFFFLCI